MYRIVFSLCLVSFPLLSVDIDFDGVEDNVDACLGTNMLDTVTSDGCSEAQKNSFKITLLQTFSYLNVDNESSLNDYSLALMLSKESWLLYLGSGYFKYDTTDNNINGFSDSTLLVEKTFFSSDKHQFKSSLFTVLPTYNSESNKIDYGVSLAYNYAYKKLNIELNYQYNFINDKNVDNLRTASFYVGYNVMDDMNGVLGYSKDSQQRENKMLVLEYRYSPSFSFSYSFIQGENNFYKSLHSLGIAYGF